MDFSNVAFDNTPYATQAIFPVISITSLTILSHGHVQNVCALPYSSFDPLVAKNIYPLAWASVANDKVGRYGE
jgi:hypothetical protein